MIGVFVGSRRLLTYRRLKDEDVKEALPARQAKREEGSTANDLNSFRKRVRLGLQLLVIVQCLTVPVLRGLQGTTSSNKGCADDRFIYQLIYMCIAILRGKASCWTKHLMCTVQNP